MGGKWRWVAHPVSVWLCPSQSKARMKACRRHFQQVKAAVVVLQVRGVLAVRCNYPCVWM